MPLLSEKPGAKAMTDTTDVKKILYSFFLFILPFFIAAAFILFLYYSLPWETFALLGSAMAAYFFPPMGKESVVPLVTYGLKKQGYGPVFSIGVAGGVVAFVDIVVGLFLMWNFDLALKIPLIGPQIKKMETKGAEVLRKKPWVRRLAFVGVALFVAFPFQGSGGVGATIVGRLIGMKKERVWYAIIIGALTGCYLIATLAYFASDAILSVFKSPAFKYIGLVVLVGVVFWAVYRFLIKNNNRYNNRPSKEKN